MNFGAHHDEEKNLLSSFLKRNELLRFSKNFEIESMTKNMSPGKECTRESGGKWGETRQTGGFRHQVLERHG